MTGAEKEECLKNLDASLKSLDESTEHMRVSLEKLLQLDPNYEHKKEHETSMEQIADRKRAMLKLREQVEAIKTEG